MGAEIQPARLHRLTSAFYRLEGSNCSGCGVKHFPSRPTCPDCGHNDFKAMEAEVNNLNGHHVGSTAQGSEETVSQQILPKTHQEQPVYKPE